MFGFKSIQTGDRAAVWDQSGGVEFVSGPQRVWLRGGRRVQVLPRHAAGPDQYLLIKFKDGHVQHLRGPAAVWLHPVEHTSIETHNALVLDGNEAIVVYSQEADRVTRRIVRGPAMFVPAANEWLHEFSWHGADPTNPSRKIPHALKFSKLRVIPDQTYVDVQDVRTADDALLVIRLMLFFELADIEKMLDQTHDPVADFFNAVSADSIDFAAARTFDHFKEQTEKLNDLASYPHLVQRAERIGYRVNKVVYRGYHASSKLQGMHDGAIEARTKLRLEAETEAQAQELADLKLQREQQRATKRQEMERADVAHRNELKRMEHEEQLKREAAAAEAKLAARRRRDEAAILFRQAQQRDRTNYLQSMNAMQIDLTRYLVARYQNPDRIIRIDGASRAQLHVHEQSG